MRIDLHVHAEERSGCARDGEEAMIQAAIAHGLDGLAFTDHHLLLPPQRRLALNRKYAPFRVFGGIEITLPEGEDVLVLGVQDPVLESRDWTYPDLLEFVHLRDGFLILAHPFRYHPISIPIERHPPDAIEVHSLHISAQSERRIRAIAERLDLPTVCNSDAHGVEHVGLYYSEFAREPRDGTELVAMLREGSYRCARLGQRIAAVNRERAAAGRYRI